MAYTAAPQAFFGPGYSLGSNAISLPTSSIADITVGTFTADGTTAVLTVSTAHNLKVGDLVSISSSTTLPAPFTAADYYVVSTPSTTTLTLATTRNGTAVVSTDTGTGTHTIKALGTLQEVTDAEANASTGDFRKVVFGLVEMMYQKHLNTATADRSAKCTVTRTSSTNETTGITTRYYQFAIQLDPVVEVTPE